MHASILVLLTLGIFFAGRSCWPNVHVLDLVGIICGALHCLLQCQASKQCKAAAHPHHDDEQGWTGAWQIRRESDCLVMACFEINPCCRPRRSSDCPRVARFQEGFRLCVVLFVVPSHVFVDCVFAVLLVCLLVQRNTSGSVAGPSVAFQGLVCEL